jgi:Uma2 family endonuclease
MTTLLKLGPTDDGRPLSLEEFLAGDYAEGYQYELIDGKLYVSPQANLPQGFVESWLLGKFFVYAKEHPEVINYVHPKARVFVPGRAKATCPEPDITAYRKFPLRKPVQQLRWQDVSPLLVVEVLSLDDPDRDLVRNVDLYREVPSIKEYWVLDTRADVERPSLLVYRRQGKKWKQIEISSGETYTTRLLPEFELILDVRHG